MEVAWVWVCVQLGFVVFLFFSIDLFVDFEEGGGGEEGLMVGVCACACMYKHVYT